MFDRRIIFPLLEARPELFLLKSGAYHTYKRKPGVHSVPYIQENTRGNVPNLLYLKRALSCSSSRVAFGQGGAAGQS